MDKWKVIDALGATAVLSLAAGGSCAQSEKHIEHDPINQEVRAQTTSLLKEYGIVQENGNPCKTEIPAANCIEVRFQAQKDIKSKVDNILAALNSRKENYRPVWITVESPTKEAPHFPISIDFKKSN